MIEFSGWYHDSKDVPEQNKWASEDTDREITFETGSY